MSALELPVREARFDDVSFWYPKASRPVLDRVSWDIDRGDFVVVAGPSGSGKSTMLRCLNGLVPHFSGGRLSGRITVQGRDTREHGPRQLGQRVGFVFQDPEAQSVARIVEDDIAFGLEQAGVTRHTMRKRVEEVLDLLGIAHLRQRDVTTLSGGERQRVAVASVLVQQPDVLVLDEPTSQLDPWGADEVLTAIHRLNDDLGLTVVVAEHRLERVAMYADRMRVVRADGPPLDARPAEAMRLLPVNDLPPLAQLAIGAGWSDIPLTIKSARRMAPGILPPIREASPLAESAAPIVTIDRLNVDLGKRPVLRDISLTIGPGEMVAIMGRNGSGKSTLLRTLLGMLPIRSGSVFVADRDMVRGKPEHLAGIAGYLPQDPSRLLFAERVRDELAVSLRYRPRSLDWAPRDAGELLDELDLGDLGDRHPRDLSVGERERAALAAVLVTAPKLLVLDEPTRGMDGARKRALMELLERERAGGAAVIMATHDVELVARWATRVVLLGKGEIVADGSPRDILSGSLAFATQINKLFGGHFLTVQDALNGLGITHTG